MIEVMFRADLCPLDDAGSHGLSPRHNPRAHSADTRADSLGEVAEKTAPTTPS